MAFIICFWMTKTVERDHSTWFIIGTWFEEKDTLGVKRNLSELLFRDPSVRVTPYKMFIVWRLWWNCADAQARRVTQAHQSL